MINMENQIVIIRSGGSIVNWNNYNCQELGLAKTLAAYRGWHVILVLAGEKYERIQFREGLGVVDIYRLKYYALNQALSFFVGIDELLEEINPTLIQVHDLGMYMSYHVVKWAYRHKTKVVLVQGSYRTTRKPIFRQLESAFNYVFGKYILKHVKGIGCKTLMAEKYIHKYCNSKTQLTYIGLDTQKFSSYELKDWKSELSIMGKKVLLYVGTLEQRRNPLFLLEVLKHLSTDFVLLIVGDGDLRHEMEREIKQNQLQNRCFMLGKRNQKELPSLYKVADLFLLASEYEIYGMVILEAMYFGVPVISTYTAGSEVLISSNWDGVIIPDLNVYNWRDEIVKLCRDEANVKRMGERAKQKIKEQFTWEMAVKKFIDLYEL